MPEAFHCTFPAKRRPKLRQVVPGTWEEVGRRPCSHTRASLTFAVMRCRRWTGVTGRYGRMAKPAR